MWVSGLHPILLTLLVTRHPAIATFPIGVRLSPEDGIDLFEPREASANLMGELFALVKVHLPNARGEERSDGRVRMMPL